MKRVLLIFLFVFLVFPVWAQEEENVSEPSETLDTRKDTEADIKKSDDNEAEHNIYEYNRVRNRTQISPKAAHDKILYKAQQKLIKDKANFDKTKRKELWLLKDEAQILDYNP